jgi:muramoyltetrapeptide carboxypeptidase LdcA involved in peptidoglycan recycling
MKNFLPSRLKPGAHIRVIAPSLSMGILSKETIDNALACFKHMGFTISFGKHAFEKDQFNSSSIQSRIADLHDAFIDPKVDGVLTAIGGYNSNQLLDYIDWNLIKDNPKLFCGYSDITILLNTITTKTGLITYYGPAFSTFGQKKLDPYEINYFLKASTELKPFVIEPSKTWSNDPWYLDQNNRNFLNNEGYWILQEGTAQGLCVGGHLGTTILLQGTEFMPTLNNTILIIEEDIEPANPLEFDRRLQSILQQPNASNIAGVLIGRFEKAYGMTQEMLKTIVLSKSKLQNKPIIANVDFGHTEPHCTLPIGGMITINAQQNSCSISVDGK